MFYRHVRNYAISRNFFLTKLRQYNSSAADFPTICKTINFFSQFSNVQTVIRRGLALSSHPRFYFFLSHLFINKLQKFQHPSIRVTPSPSSSLPLNPISRSFGKRVTGVYFFVLSWCFRPFQKFSSRCVVHSLALYPIVCFKEFVYVYTFV